MRKCLWVRVLKAYQDKMKKIAEAETRRREKYDREKRARQNQ